METYTDIEVRYEDKVAHIIINRPDKLNAIRIKTYRELISALQEADDSPDCHLIVLEGSGGQFTAGNDLADLVGADKQQVMDGVQGIFNCVAGLKKVVIGVVEGVAVGIGTTLLLHCDLVVASSKTRFRLPFANLGVCPEGGSSVLLPQAIGQKMAREVLLTGRFFSAEEALRWGLINSVFETGKAAEAAQHYIVQLLRQPLDSLIATKKLMRASMADVEEVVSNELLVFGELLEKDETRQRIAGLLKR
ncbi:enoyl-CoA hydratase-related protein [Desulfopila inferna]|uniref:enoyl-CoA hydratase-related protein n=1 Tax=Desulfopila inferna TaxID=468528 RepID=UPI001966C58E|nr:enoyl-CoA hydratase-related protein [Desulfopila inferna]MBM9603856.1 enoyl-CoA hydratase/isomerase family protein [Desulfopila inferna]